MPADITRRTFVAAAGAATLAMAACSARAAMPTTSQQDSLDSPTSPLDVTPPSEETSTQSSRVDDLLATLSMDQRVAQLIMPAVRTWEGVPATDLASMPQLAEALRAHQYGGIILFGSNIVDTEQTVRLVHDLQANNEDAAQDGASIPYLVAADQEGGTVARISMGTRGTGSMAIGATGAGAEQAALDTGTVFGEELAALGINVDFGPCLDIINDLGDLGMSTRVFSDDPETVAALGSAFGSGLARSGVIATYKHFPGAGDGSDNPTAVRMSLDQLQAEGLAPFRRLIDGGAEMVMTSAVTFPGFDDTQALGDSVTYGHYPATISPKIVRDMLRDELGYDGVVVTDALEMEQFMEEPDTGVQLLPGQLGTVEYAAGVAERALGVGCDILLIPTDLNGSDAAGFFDAYVAELVRRVEEGAIDAHRIEESVRRILALKERHGILDLVASGQDVEQDVKAAQSVVGSAEHHDAERTIAERAVTLLKDDGTLPLAGWGGSTLLLGRTPSDATPLAHALNALMGDGTLDPGARIENMVTGEASGPQGASTRIVIDCHYDSSSGTSLYGSRHSAEVADADCVVCLSATGPGIDALQDDNPALHGIASALADAHASGTRFVLLSANLPTDTARFQDADAIVCAYLAAGADIDPTTRNDGTASVGAFNANIPAAVRAIFGATPFQGELPISVHVLERDDFGVWTFSDEVLYAHGFHA